MKNWTYRNWTDIVSLKKNTFGPLSRYREEPCARVDYQIAGKRSELELIVAMSTTEIVSQALTSAEVKVGKR